jgi:hypothetical protein
MKIKVGKYYRMRNGDVVGPLKRAKIFDEVQLWAGHYWFRWKNDGTFHKDDLPDMDLISEVYVSDTPPSDDVMLNLSKIARTKTKAMGEGNFGMDENPPCGIRLRWLVEVVDKPHDTPLLNVQKTEDKWRARLLAAGPGSFLEVHDRKTLRDEIAMAALTGFAANPNNAAGTEESAQWAYRYADAMMEARKK